MDCFKIDWSGFYPLNEAKSRPEARNLGLYAVYKLEASRKILWYIGKATEIGTRLNKHRQEWQQVLTPREIDRLLVAIGVITPLERSRVSRNQLNDIESLFRHEYNPKRNDKSTMKGYKGKSILVINIGKIGQFDKLTTHDKPLLKLIRDSLTTKRRPSNPYPF